MVNILGRASRVIIILASLLFSKSIHGKMIAIHSAKQYEKLIDRGTPLVVEFTADWCGACKIAEKPFKKLSRESNFSRVTFAKIDVDELPEVARLEGVRGIPTFIYISDRIKKGQTVGIENPNTFINHMRQNIHEKLLSCPTKERRSCPQRTTWWKIKHFIQDIGRTMWKTGIYIIKSFGGFFSFL